jgi:hypothetical protein
MEGKHGRQSYSRSGSWRRQIYIWSIRRPRRFSHSFPFLKNLGAEVSEWVKRHFVALLKANKDYQAGKYQKALKDTFLNMDKEMLKPDGQKELL